MNKSIDQINVDRLIELRDYFKTLPENYDKFKMKYFATDRNGDIVIAYQVPECGTSMCLLGHLPLLGYPGLEDEDWNEYACRVLNIHRDAVWEYLFAPIWPNDIQLAVQRLDDVINKRKSTILNKGNITNLIIKEYNELMPRQSLWSMLINYFK